MNRMRTAVCPGCTLLCDDVAFGVREQKIESDVECSEAQKWIEWANSTIGSPEPSDEEVKTLIAQLATRMKQSKMPAFTGLASLTLQGQQAAWKIADAAGAVVGNWHAHRSQGSLYALQRQGKVSASLGEIANRGDLLIFWFCDPVQTHPRLLEKLKSTSNKTVVVIDSTKTKTGELADHFFQVDENDAVEFLSKMRRLLAKRDSAALKGTDGLASKAGQLVDLAATCDYGCFIYGHLRSDSVDDPLTLGHQKWVRRLNDHTRMVSIGLRCDGNGQSGENVMAAFSGYPTAVSHANGIPQYCGDIWSTGRLLEEGQCDFLLLFAGRNTESELASLGSDTRANLAAVAKVVVYSGPRPKDASLHNASMLPIAIAGASGTGEYCRLDDVLLPMAALRKSKLQSDQQVLARVYDAFC